MIRSSRPLHRRLAAMLLWLSLANTATAFERPGDLPHGDGRDEVFYLCSACHSLDLVVQQGMNRALWDDTLTLMVTKHGMPQPSAEEHERILNYLAAVFPPPEKRGWQNPFQTD